MSMCCTYVQLTYKDLRWVAKRTLTFSRKCIEQVVKNAVSMLLCELQSNRSKQQDLHRLFFSAQTVKKLSSTCTKFDHDQSERKSSQVKARGRKSWPNGVPCK